MASAYRRLTLLDSGFRRNDGNGLHLNHPSGVIQRHLVLRATLFIVLAVLISLFQAGEAAAHPLGNFTINRYSRVELASSSVQVRYVIDMAEIPAFQERAVIDLDRDGQISDEEAARYLAGKVEELRRGVSLAVDGRPVSLTASEPQLEFPPGQGGLPTLRIGMVLEAQWDKRGGAERGLYYRDANYAQKLGWKEIVVRAGEGVSLLSSTVPAEDQSQELRVYPQDRLASPPAHQEARATFRFTAEARSQASASGAAAPSVARKDYLTGLLTEPRLTPIVVLLSLLAAVALGALHALSPGHGKTIMAAYLVGARGTPAQAVLLGLTVAVSHTLGVVALGLVTVYAAHLVSPEQLYPWLGLGSGVIVIAIGAWLLATRLRAHVEHEHPHGHSHGPEEVKALPVTWRNLVALGVAGGLLPSASALIILLAAISLHRIAFGLLLILAFSAGMAVVLAGTGLLLVIASRLVERLSVPGPLVRAFQWRPRS